jgi:hypothetical protein
MRAARQGGIQRAAHGADSQLTAAYSTLLLTLEAALLGVHISCGTSQQAQSAPMRQITLQYSWYSTHPVLLWITGDLQARWWRAGLYCLMVW